MAESEHPQSSPNQPPSDAGADLSEPEKSASDIAIAAMLGAGAPRSTGSWHPPSPEELQPSFPQFKIGPLLGRGGMGAVYMGWQKSLDRRVAIKILPPEIDDGAARFAERFQREGKAMARFSHPGIVHVYDAGETQEGLLYLVMEYIQGTDLQERLAAQGPLPPDEALDIASHVCDALSYAHRQGVIHRDIKPSNVMIDTEGRVKVADFGLAKVVSNESTLLTGSQISMGTRDYMAPEQVMSMNVDQRADIYSLGVMLYEMLCGQAPKGIFDPPSHRTDCDVRIDKIVLRAMHQQPARRYSSSQEMKADLDAARAPIPPASNGGAPQQVNSPPPRLPETVVATAALPPAWKKLKLPVCAGLAVVAIAIAVILWTKRKSPIRPASPPLASADAIPALRERRVPPTANPAETTKEEPFVNTLGMKFVPVPILGGPTGGQRVLFSIWDTRVQDYEVFATETGREWPKPDFPQGPTHPAVMVSWDDTQVFCQWLTAREQQAGRLATGWRYRLPSDQEWSCAVDLGAREDPNETPSEKSGKIDDAFPWGSEWPPPARAGNYAGEDPRPALVTGKHGHPADVIAGYDDGFVNTSPSGSFAANRFGLFDMGGNAWQWCEDFFDKDAKTRVLRGASWNNSQRAILLSSNRGHFAPDLRGSRKGFRCVLGVSSQ